MKITNPKNLIMNGNNSSKVLFSLIIILIATFHACKKEDSSGGTAAQQAEFASATSESDAEAETIFNDVFDNVMGVNDEVALGGTGVFSAKRSNVEVGGVTV